MNESVLNTDLIKSLFYEFIDWYGDDFINEIKEMIHDVIFRIAILDDFSEREILSLNLCKLNNLYDFFNNPEMLKIKNVLLDIQVKEREILKNKYRQSA